MLGMLAYSRTGHDSGEIYLIVGADDKYVYLCDGRLKKLAAPKKKNRRHIGLIKKEMQEAHASVKDRLINGGDIKDEEIKFVIKQFKRKQEVPDV